MIVLGVTHGGLPSVAGAIVAQFSDEEATMWKAAIRLRRWFESMKRG
jgi:hypothetical protein